MASTSHDLAAMPLSLSYYTVPELTPPETVSVAAEAGCRYVGARLLGGQPGRDQLPIMSNQALRRETLRRLRETGLAVLDANTARLIPETEIAAYQPFLDVAAELGARHVLATGDDPEESRLIDNFARLCALAADRGLSVEIEFVPWLVVSNLTDATRIVRAVNVPNLGIAVDALHFDRSRCSLDELAATPRSWLKYLQICDAPEDWPPDRAALIHTAVKERLFPGEGAIDLVGLLRAMPCGIPLALEIPMATLAQTMGAAERVARAVSATRKILSIAFP